MLQETALFTLSPVNDSTKNSAKSQCDNGASLVEAPTLRAKAAHSRVAATSLASIRCTEDGTDVIDGRKVDVVVGLPEGSERRVRFFPGIVPVTPPPEG